MKAPVSEFVLWEEARVLSGLSLNGWVRRACCEVARVELALFEEGQNDAV